MSGCYLEKVFDDIHSNNFAPRRFGQAWRESSWTTSKVKDHVLRAGQFLGQQVEEQSGLPPCDFFGVPFAMCQVEDSRCAKRLCPPPPVALGIKRQSGSYWLYEVTNNSSRSGDGRHRADLGE